MKCDAAILNISGEPWTSKLPRVQGESRQKGVKRVKRDSQRKRGNRVRGELQQEEVKGEWVEVWSLTQFRWPSSWRFRWSTLGIGTDSICSTMTGSSRRFLIIQWTLSYPGSAESQFCLRWAGSEATRLDYRRGSTNRRPGYGIRLATTDQPFWKGCVTKIKELSETIIEVASEEFSDRVFHKT